VKLQLILIIASWYYLCFAHFHIKCWIFSYISDLIIHAIARDDRCILHHSQLFNRKAINASKVSTVHVNAYIPTLFMIPSDISSVDHGDERHRHSIP
jgi:hypothetical protein